MAVFRVFEHPTNDPDRTVFVREGFSGRAFVFSVLWALWHRMWAVAALLLAIFGSIMLVSQYSVLSELFVSLLNLAAGLIFGFEAQALRAASLSRAGYREAALVAASGVEEAEIKYLHDIRRPEIGAVSVTRMEPGPADTLGLFGPA